MNIPYPKVVLPENVLLKVELSFVGSLAFDTALCSDALTFVEKGSAPLKEWCQLVSRTTSHTRPTKKDERQPAYQHVRAHTRTHTHTLAHDLQGALKDKLAVQVQLVQSTEGGGFHIADAYSSTPAPL